MHMVGADATVSLPGRAAELLVLPLHLEKHRQLRSSLELRNLT
jgi:hypothetical protein